MICARRAADVRDIFKRVITVLQAVQARLVSEEPVIIAQSICTHQNTFTDKEKVYPSLQPRVKKFPYA